MEHRLEVDAYRAVIRVCLHDVSHKIPPLAVDRCVCTFCPQLLILDLDVAIQNIGLFIQKDGVVFSPFADIFPGARSSARKCPKGDGESLHRLPLWKKSTVDFVNLFVVVVPVLQFYACGVKRFCHLLEWQTVYLFTPNILAISSALCVFS